MRVTDITQQHKNLNRVNVMVDGKFRFSLDMFQVADLGIRVGREYSDRELGEFETESQFGKLYSRALEYCLMRPHSAREVRDYLYRKTRTTKYKSRSTGELKERAGVSQVVADRVYKRLASKGYIDDEKFAAYWVENRHQTKGVSKRKLQMELMAKGIDRTVIEHQLHTSNRTDMSELQKVITRKRARYSDDQKFMSYLARQGFSYDDIKSALTDEQY
jgi:regulatory protein